MTYKIILVPEKAVVPEDIGFPVVDTGDIIEKIYAGREQEVIVPVNTRELQLLVEYRDLFSVEVRAVIGLTGAMYNTIWNTYISTMKRVTLDNLKSEVFERNNEKADFGQRSDSTVETRQRAFARVIPISQGQAEDDDAAIGTIE